MSATLVVPNQTASTIIVGLGFSREQVDLVKSTVAVGATDMELAMFLQVSKHRGLDPLARQIYFIKRRVWRNGGYVEVGTMQTGIDGFRLIADRTGLSDGQDDAEYEYESDGHRLRKATVRVWKKGVSRPYVGSAFFSEYAETTRDGELTMMWRTKPHIMLAKCAEGLALRKAFPENLSGLYTDDEMPTHTIEGAAIVNDAPADVTPTGTVSKMPENGARTHVEPTSDEIPPADAPANDLRAWLGRRLNLGKSWSREQMAIACGEVAHALRLSEDVVTPRTLGEHLVAYRNAIVAGPSAAQDVTDPAAAVIDAAAPTEATERRVDARGAIIVLLAEMGLANDSEELQAMCGRITEDSVVGVRYGWESLDDAEMARLRAMLESVGAIGETVPA